MITLRPAKEHDCQMYFEWVNEPSVREQSINSQIIRWSDHREWFTKSMKSPNTYMYVMENNNVPSGQIRFEIEGGKAKIDYSIEKNYRGKGLGTQILMLGVDKLISDYGKSVLIEGIVKKTNLYSGRAFLKSGFKKIAEDANYYYFQLDYLKP